MSGKQLNCFNKLFLKISIDFINDSICELKSNIFEKE